MEPRPPVGVTDIQKRLVQAIFGRPLVTNVLRGHVAEAIVATALEPQWRWCSEDYASWDFERADGIRLEVKQSAARQSWATASSKPSQCSFDIAARTGYWDEGVKWIAEPGRQAHLYVFAHHGIAEDHADHRLPEQWTFYVVPASALPATRRIGITRLRQLSQACSYADLKGRVESAADAIAADRAIAAS